MSDEAVPPPPRELPASCSKASRRCTARRSDYQRESLLRSLENANRLLDSPAAKAFDLSLEPKTSYDAYNTGRFGLGCLLARRLIEAGARFIEVTTEYIPFNWLGHARQRPHAAAST